MPLNPEAIRSHPFAPIEETLTDTACMLYALSIGVGRDPLDADDLPYVYEDGLHVFPSMPVVLGRPGFWMGTPGLGINPKMVVHGTQRLRIHRPLMAGATFVAVNRVLELVDKGASGGAIIVTERTLHDKASGALLASMEAGNFCRTDGGFGGPRSPSHEFAAVPDRVPDASCEIPTVANQALYYRLNGDRNPLHASPAFAKQAGFDKPILHGLCSFGIATHTLIRHGGHGGPLRSIEARFSKPVFPGETIRFDMWNKPDGVAFRACASSTGMVVLDRGLATF
jgi:acyl dehydratase